MNGNSNLRFCRFNRKILKILEKVKTIKQKSLHFISESAMIIPVVNEKEV